MEEQVRGVGRAIFAAIYMLVVGTLNIIYGIGGISNSHFFTHNNNAYVFGTLKTWGWVTLFLGILELLAAFSLFGGGTFGRWFGMIAAGLVAIAWLLMLPAAPFLSIAMFALALWIIHGLAIYGTEA